MVLGRLMTDEAFRAAFAIDRHRVLSALLQTGTRLSHAEIAALMAIDLPRWERLAAQIDPRLQKASLKP